MDDHLSATKTQRTKRRTTTPQRGNKKKKLNGSPAHQKERQLMLGQCNSEGIRGRKKVQHTVVSPTGGGKPKKAVAHQGNQKGEARKKGVVCQKQE